MSDQRVPRLGVLQRRGTDDREAQWCTQYGLVQTRRDECPRVFDGRWCLAYHASGCPDRALHFNRHAIRDHGHFYRRPGERMPLLFLGQPYDPLYDAEDIALIDRLRTRGLFVRIGVYGEGWYSSRTFPIVISRAPIPDHGYVCIPYDDSEAALIERYASHGDTPLERVEQGGHIV